MKMLSIPMKTLHLGFGMPFEANEVNNLIQNPSAWETNKQKMYKPGSQLGLVIVLADSNKWNVQN